MNRVAIKRYKYFFFFWCFALFLSICLFFIVFLLIRFKKIKSSICGEKINKFDKKVLKVGSQISCEIPLKSDNKPSDRRNARHAAFISTACH